MSDLVRFGVAMDRASSLLVPLDAGRCLQVMALRGRAAELAALAGQRGGTKGVLTCALTLAAVLPPEPHGARAPRR